MAGYDWNRGKSNNAVLAEEAGYVTASKINKAWLEESGIDLSPAFVKWLIRIGEIGATEWHHTSKVFNRTNFYSHEDVKYQLDNLEELGILTFLQEAYKQPENRKLNAEEAFELKCQARRTNN